MSTITPISPEIWDPYIVPSAQPYVDDEDED
jgi:hypothetical protein